MYKSDFINSENYDPKFYVADTVGFGDWPKPISTLGTTGGKIAVVYQTWSTPMYMPYIYHSMLSQIMYTDICEVADTFLFVDEEQYDNAKIQFKHILDEKNIIKEERLNVVKYMIPTHPILENYDAVVIVDSDMFFWQTNGSSSFYFDILKRFQENDNQFIMLETEDASFEILEERRENLCKRVDKKDYMNFLSKSSGCSKKEFSKYLQDSNWFLSCLFAYSPKQLYQAEYNWHATRNKIVRQYCDETVWITWAFSKNIKINDLYKDCGWKFHLTYENSDLEEYDKDKLQLIHPLTGPNRENSEMVDFIRKIQNDCIRGKY